MLCCLVLIVVVGCLRWLWFALPGTGHPQEPGFAPPARRAAPGDTPASSPPVTATLRPRSIRSPILHGVAVGVAAYAVFVPMLGTVGIAQTLVPGFAMWVARDLALGALAVAGVMLAKAGPMLPRDRETAGWALLGAGAAWGPVGVIDMHVLGMFEIAHGAIGWDVVFHGLGSLAALGGGLTVWAAKCSPRSRPLTEVSWS